jgi:hypothetical protein
MAEKPPSQSEDLVIMGPPVGDEGAHLCQRRSAEGIDFQVIRPIQEGEPIPDNAVDLKHISGPFYSSTPARKGPSTAASPAFRSGWDRIFGKSADVGQA